MTQVFVRKEAVGEFGKDPSERTTQELLKSAVINIDKAGGPTSHQVSDYVKKILHVSKAGHSGTLDPGVSGVQPVAIGSATRITQFLLTAPKEYVCLMHLHKDHTSEQVMEVAAAFVGKITQMPPVKSAVKRQLREREIYEFEVIEHKKRDVLFRVKCQAGTYVRKICTEFGKRLGSGAHMAKLRRTQAGPFREADKLVTLNDVADAYAFYKDEGNDKLLRHCLQPIELAVKHMKKCWIFDTTITSVTHGRDVAIPGISKMENFRKEELVAVMTLKNELVAVGFAQMSAVQANTLEKGIAVNVKKVFLSEQ